MMQFFNKFCWKKLFDRHCWRPSADVFANVPDLLPKKQNKNSLITWYLIIWQRWRFWSLWKESGLWMELLNLRLKGEVYFRWRGFVQHSPGCAHACLQSILHFLRCVYVHTTYGEDKEGDLTVGQSHEEKEDNTKNTGGVLITPAGLGYMRETTS